MNICLRMLRFPRVTQENWKEPMAQASISIISPYSHFVLHAARQHSAKRTSWKHDLRYTFSSIICTPPTLYLPWWWLEPGLDLHGSHWRCRAVCMDLPRSLWITHCNCKVKCALFILLGTFSNIRFSWPSLTGLTLPRSVFVSCQ